jgi:hypothetical protein
MDDYTLKLKRKFTGFLQPETGRVHFHSLYGEDHTFCGEAFDNMEDGGLMELFVTDTVTCPECIKLIKSTDTVTCPECIKLIKSLKPYI